MSSRTRLLAAMAAVALIAAACASDEAPPRPAAPTPDPAAEITDTARPPAQPDDDATPADTGGATDSADTTETAADGTADASEPPQAAGPQAAPGAGGVASGPAAASDSPDGTADSADTTETAGGAAATPESPQQAAAEPDDTAGGAAADALGGQAAAAGTTAGPGTAGEAGTASVAYTPEVVAEPISAPLTRCIEAGLPLSGRVSALVGLAGEGRYHAVVAGGADSCELIRAWWDALRAAEADRIAGGQYPCEYPAAYEYDWLRPDWNGPPHVVGCWPQILIPGAAHDDPEHEAARLAYNSGYHTLPPNDPVLVEALYGCYHEALEGPPPGWEPPYDGAAWITLLRCHNVMQTFGNPVRELGVSPECAARQFTAQIRAFHTAPPPASASGAYAGGHSWANCETDASRLIGAGFATFAERCAAVLTASAGPKTDHLAAYYGVTVDQLVAFLDTIICQDGTKETLRQYPQYYGDFVADWTPPEDSICYEAAMLGAARASVRQEWIRVLYC